MVWTLPWLRWLFLIFWPQRPCLIWKQSVYSLWWTEWHWDRLLWENFGFLPVICHFKVSHFHFSVILACYNRPISDQSTQGTQFHSIQRIRKIMFIVLCQFAWKSSVKTSLIENKILLGRGFLKHHACYCSVCFMISVAGYSIVGYTIWCLTFFWSRIF